MTNTNTVEWGNIELPGLSDEVLLNPKHLANLMKSKDPKWKEAQQLGVIEKWKDEAHHAERIKYWSDPNFKEKIKKQRKEIGKRPEIREMRKTKMLELHQDPKFKKNYQAGRDKLKGNPSEAVLNANKEAGKKRCKSLIADGVEYAGLTICARALGIAVGTLQTRMKNHPDKYYYITK